MVELYITRFQYFEVPSIFNKLPSDTVWSCKSMTIGDGVTKQNKTHHT